MPDHGFRCTANLVGILIGLHLVEGRNIDPAPNYFLAARSAWLCTAERPALFLFFNWALCRVPGRARLAMLAEASCLNEFTQAHLDGAPVRTCQCLDPSSVQSRMILE